MCNILFSLLNTSFSGVCYFPFFFFYFSVVLSCNWVQYPRHKISTTHIMTTCCLFKKMLINLLSNEEKLASGDLFAEVFYFSFLFFFFAVVLVATMINSNALGAWFERIVVMLMCLFVGLTRTIFFHWKEGELLISA